jgi:hypothetical protein
MGVVRYIGVLVATALVAAAMAAGASAQTPTGSGYGGGASPLGGVEGEGTSQTGVSGTLPFTGVDLALLVVGGVLLAAVGAGLVRASARR